MMVGDRGPARKRIMILGASILQKSAIVTARGMGLEVVAVDMNPQAVGFQDADIKVVTSTNDIQGCVAAAMDLRVDGVMTLATDSPVCTVAAVAEALGLVGVSQEVAMKATNKGLMRDCLRGHDVPVPHYVRTRGYQEFCAAIKRFQPTCVVKPADSSGSRGIFLVNDPGDSAQLERAYDYSRAFSGTGEVLVEEFMEGAEVSVETLSHDGQVRVLAITDKVTNGAPHFVEMGHSQPSRIEVTMQKLIGKVATDAVTAIGIENGPAHVEIIVTRDGPKIVELGARLGGDNIASHLVPISTGIDVIRASIQIAMGDRPHVQVTRHQGAAIRYLPQQPIGMIKAIIGVAQARSIEGVIDVALTQDVGNTVRPIRSSTDRLGFVIAQAYDAASAIRICEEALSRIFVEVDCRAG